MKTEKTAILMIVLSAILTTTVIISTIITLDNSKNNLERVIESSELQRLEYEKKLTKIQLEALNEPNIVWLGGGKDEVKVGDKVLVYEVVENRMYVCAYNKYNLEKLKK